MLRSLLIGVPCVLLAWLILYVLCAGSAPPKSRPVYDESHLIVGDDCDDTCYAHWRYQLQRVYACSDGLYFIAWDPSRGRRVIWDQTESSYREVEPHARNVDLCPAPASTSKPTE